MKEYSAKINCDYTDDGKEIAIDFSYGDSNGVKVRSQHRGNDVDEITSALIQDILCAMSKKRDDPDKPKKPEEMTREELLEAVKLLEREANEQHARNDMLENRLKVKQQQQSKRQPKVEKQIETEKDRKAKSKEYNEAESLLNEYRNLIRMFVR